MSFTDEQLMGGMLVTILPIMFLYFWKTMRLEGYLRDKHTETWESLGSPHLIKNNNPSNGMKVLMFFIKGDYKKLGDDELNRHAKHWIILVTICTSFSNTLFGLWYLEIWLTRSER